jgi:hypothetical protein
MRARISEIRQMGHAHAEPAGDSGRGSSAKQGEAMSKLNPIASEPLVVATIATGITWFGARYGINVDPAPATAIAGAVLLVGTLFARQQVTPVAKVDAENQKPVDTSTLEAVASMVLAKVQPSVKATQPAVMTADPSVTPNATVDTGALTRRAVPPPPDPGKPGVIP